MAIFSSNKDLDSSLIVIGIHVLMGFAIYFHAKGQIDASLLSQLVLAYTGICSALFGKGMTKQAESGGQKQ